MTAVDGLPFAVFVTSNDLRAALRAKTLQEIPKSATTIRKTVTNYASKLRICQKKEITELISKGTRFSLTLDEWTSLRNRRYLNINVHCVNSFWNLGLVPIRGSFTSDACLGLIRAKLKTYGLDLENHIVSAVTDGPSVMVKLGKLMPIIHQKCFAHAIQLAILEILYKKKKEPEEILFNAEAELDQENEEGSINETAFESEDSDQSDNENNANLIFEEPVDPIANEQLQPIILKVRQVVKFFKKSAKSNEILQKYALLEFKADDTKTRWNSLFEMLNRFYKLRSCIKKTLIDVKSHYEFNDEEIIKIGEIVECLKPIKAVVEALCRQDANLLTSSAALQFALQKLKDQGSELSEQLLFALTNRIKERTTETYGVLCFLHTGKLLQDDENLNLFSPAQSVNDIAKIIKNLVVRLFGPWTSQAVVNTPVPEIESTAEVPTASTETNINQDGQVEEVVPNKKTKTTIDDELNEAINIMITSEHKGTHQPAKSLLATIKKEITLFEQGGSRGHHLKLIYDCLQTIPPTSVEAERAFSSAGYLCNKIRSNLKDDTLDQLCFLRSHFRNIRS